jgi:heme exporter protein C
MWGTFWVWDARLTSVLILFFIYLGALRFQEFSADVASIFICIGLINIPIIKFSVNWWNTLHQPSSISQFGTSIHISMLIPILLIFTSFFFLTGISSILETRRIILSFSGFSVKNQINLQSNNRKQVFFYTNNKSSKST